MDLDLDDSNHNKNHNHNDAESQHIQQSSNSQSSNALNENAAKQTSHGFPPHFQFHPDFFKAMAKNSTQVDDKSNNNYSNMSDLKQLLLDVNGMQQGKYVKPNKAANKLGMKKPTYINKLKIIKCMERKNREANMVQYQFDSVTCAMSVEDYVSEKLGYDNATKLYNDKANNCGNKYSPNFQWLGLGVNNQ